MPDELHTCAACTYVRSHTLSFTPACYQTHNTNSQFFLPLWTIVKEEIEEPLHWPPRLLESGSIPVPVALQGCHRCRNRKSIKALMNQHSAQPMCNTAFYPTSPLSPSSSQSSAGTDYRDSITDKPIKSSKHLFIGCCLSKKMPS